MLRRIAVLGFAALLEMRAAAGRPEEKATLNGTVTYSEQVALPVEASLSVRLEEEAKPDASRRTIAEATIPTEGRQVPIPFALSYDPGRIDPTKRYTVRGTISSRGKTLYRTAAAYPVLTRGAPGRVTVVLEPPGRRRRPHATPTSPPEPTAPEPSPTAPPESSPSRSPRSSGRTAPG